MELVTILSLVIAVISVWISILGGYEGITFSKVITSLFQMIGMNLFVFIAVLPVVAFAFFYGFAGTFASGHGLAALYPVTAGLVFINHQNGSPAELYNSFLSLLVLSVLIVITAILLYFSHEKDTI